MGAVKQWGAMLKHEKNQALSQSQSLEINQIPPRWLRPGAAAKYASISRSTLYAAISAGTIRSCKVKGCRIIDILELDRFISSHVE